MPEQRIAVDPAVSLHVEVDGDGPPLLLVNPAMSTVRSWDYIVPLLSRDFQIIRFDVRGKGSSDPGPSDHYRFERYGDDIAAILDHLDVADSYIWGMAWGARVALVAAAIHPRRLTRLMLADFAIDPADVAAQKQGYLTAKAALADEFVTVPERPLGWNTHHDGDAAAKALAATHHHADLMGFVERIEQPTLIATGEHDPNLISSRRALPGFTHAVLEVVPLAGHVAAFQRPDLMAELALAHFL